MCGFAGVLSASPAPGGVDERRALVERMGARLAHRGPDDKGVWVDETGGLSLAHRRLAIIDLSEHGHQPMHSTCGRYVIAYNGEIYNFPALREELESDGCRFRGHSDTEVLLEAMAGWGLDRTLERIQGMFAFAVWDRKKGRLHLARDRAGKKPLYYGWAGKDLVFASELKALEAHPRFDGEIDRAALTAFLRLTYVPTPRSIYRNVFKLRQAARMTLTADDAAAGPAVFDHEGRTEIYWSATELALRGQERPFRGSDDEAVERLDGLLGQAVAGRMIADVPLGAFLSGGIDSSIVVALMQRQSTRPVRTFSIGFHHEHNEAEFAGAVARHLGTEHTELYVDGKDTLAVVGRMPQVYDEPFADSSQIPTWIISHMARQHVTVALSGDGGDELFFGYRRYLRGRKIWSSLRRLPLGLRRTLARGVRLTARSRPREGKLHALAADLEAASPDAMFRNRVSFWKNPSDLVLGGSEPATLSDEVAACSGLDDPDRRMMLLDLLTFLADDILVKVDRASMAVSLEVRAPLLDHRVIELALALPMSMKLRDGQGKWILRQVLARYVPPRLTERPKTGFGSPIATWLRGPLREWAEALIDEQRLRREGYFDPRTVRGMWDENLSGRRKWHNHLWPVLMFQAWLEVHAM